MRLLDVESRSRADLTVVGGRNYWEAPSTEALCVVHYDTDSKEYGLWLPGDPCPLRPGEEWAAHNAIGFDRFALARLGWRALDDAPERVIDTSELARTAGLPGALDALGARWLGMRKDKVASKFTKGLSSCRRPSGKHNPAAITPDVWRTFTPEEKRARGVQPELTREALERSVTYCFSDVEIMVHGWPLLESWRDLEPDVVRVARRINDRGIGFDSQLAKRLLEEDARNSSRELERVARELGDDWTATKVADAARSPAQFCALTGAENAQAATIDAILAAPAEHSEGAVLLSQARRALASIARGKLEAGLALVSPDDRLRDTHKYCGAHTFRTSGKGMQLHNMPRPAKRFEKWGDAEVCALADSVLGGAHADAAEIDLLVRACLVARPGHTFATCDFSGVEGRAAAWCSGDLPALDAIARKLDDYITTAAAIFGVRYEDIAKSDPRRQAGKVAVLACLAADTLVLTDRGWQAITNVCTSDRVWDGIAWVNHGGLVPRGTRQVVDLYGLKATPDHLVWCGKTGWSPFAELARVESTRSLALENASASLLSPGFCVCRRAECASCWCAAIVGPTSTECTLTTYGKDDPRGAISALKSSQGITRNGTAAMPRSCLTTSTVGGCLIASHQSCSGAETPAQSSIATTAGAAYECTRHGARTAQRFSRTLSRYQDGTTLGSSSTGEKTKVGTSQEICGSLPSVLTAPTAATCKACSGVSSSSRPVYDLADAGPLNRFTVWTDAGPLIVHNCGYQGGWRALEKMARQQGIDLASSGADSRKIVEAWRKLHPAIVKAWADCEAAFLAAARGETAQWSLFTFTPSEDGEDVAIWMPNGRPMVYPKVQIGNGKYGKPSLSYEGHKDARPIDPQTGERYGEPLPMREHVYGGLVLENVIQSMCRELMASAMVRVDDAGLCPVLEVYDELACEVPVSAAQEAYDYLHATMVDVPEWADGFPAAAAGHLGFRYRK